MLTRGTGVGLSINRTAAGTSGITAMPVTGIDGHRGLYEAMMKGGRHGHWNGTETILRRPGETVVAH